MDLDELRRRAAAAASPDDEVDNPLAPERITTTHRYLSTLPLSIRPPTDTVAWMAESLTRRLHPQAQPVSGAPRGRRFPGTGSEPNNVPCFIEIDGGLERCGYYGESMSVPVPNPDYVTGWDFDSYKCTPATVYSPSTSLVEYRLHRFCVVTLTALHPTVAIYAVGAPGSLAVEACANGNVHG